MPSETSSAALTATVEQLTADIPRTVTPQPPAASSTASRQPPTVTHTAIASPQPTTLPTRIVDDFGVTMALVPAGEFQMGCDPANKFNYSCDSDELPLHTVYLDDFYIDIFEVTNAQFSSVVNEHGNQKESVVTWLYYGSQDFVRVHLSQDVWKADSGYEDHPVVGVSWYGARAFCEWRGSRLPTEAEWEKAARGANDTRAYPWGDQKPSCSLANFLGCVGGTSPVGSYPQGASPYGVLDMAGNVHEWLNDWYQSDYYIQSPTSNPLGPTSGSRKVYRGGIYISPWHLLRVSFRTATFGPGSYTKYSGIRCAASPGK
jgi:formylglycine-generating enzyme required for sulfatase activity